MTRPLLSLLCIVMLLAFLASISGVTAQTTIYVPDDYASIQDAVDAASPGDTIVVRDGTYTENVVINKRVTLRSENGSDSTTVRGLLENEPVLGIAANYVTVVGLQVRSGDVNSWAGIQGNSSYCVFSDNFLIDNRYGLFLTGDNNTISSNTIASNRYGIELWSASGNDIEGNTISSNNQGVRVYQYSNSNTISNNIISYNGGYPGIPIGLYLEGNSTSNYIYVNSFLGNLENAGSQNLPNTWNSPSEITYSYNDESHTGYLGNYFDDYEGEDADINGVGDTPYDIEDPLGDAVMRDYYPLMWPYKNGVICCAPSDDWCFIATAASGADSSSVEALRSFRDRYLRGSHLGSGFVSAYYGLSPPVAEFVDEHPTLKALVRTALLPAVGVSNGAIGLDLTAKMVTAASMLVLSAAAMTWLRRRAVSRGS